MVRFLSLLIFACSLGWSFEGLYEVTLICEDRTNPNCTELNRKAKLAIIKTPKVLAVSIGYPEQSLTRYAFISDVTSLSNRRYEGVQPLGSDSSGRFSQIQLDFSLDFSEAEQGLISVQGFIRDARFLKDITLAGNRILPPEGLSRDETSQPNPSLPIESEGRFLARGINRTWLLTLRKALVSSNSEELLAEITDLGNPNNSELASGDRTYLKSMQNEHNQLEFFTPLSQTGAFLKWIILSDLETVFRASKLSGFFYSSNGVYSPLTIERL